MKKFGVIPLAWKLVGMNNRFASLFETFDIRHRFMDDSLTVLDTDLDWKKIGAIFKKLQSSCDLLIHIR
jgi:hypothetical protein